MNISVLIPTYRRCKDLIRCLDALKQQTRPADEVLIVVRDADVETWEALTYYAAAPLPLKTITVTVPGQVAALNLGLKTATGDIISITDDDAAPFPHWLERIEYHFANDARVGGVGGRDWLYIGGTDLEEGSSAVVGRVQWFGRVVGRHNLGVGDPREVDVLKGANMSYRKEAIAHLRFNPQLLGSGAQVHNDLAFSLAVKRSGWTLIYDPTVEINHYQAKRFDEDQREQFNDVAFFNAVHNETVALLDFLPLHRQVIFLAWAFLVGTRKAFGFVQWCRFVPQEGPVAGQKWWASIRGRWAGLKTWWRGRHQHSLSPDSISITSP